MSEREAYIAFSAFPGIGPQRFKLLTGYFGTAEKAWNADYMVLKKIGLGEKLSAKLVDFRKNFSAPDYINQLLKREIKIVARNDPQFPELLKQIPDPPIALFVKGKLPDIWDRVIGVVGTRKPTAYGKQVTEKFVRELASLNFTIVSGLARGIDGIAHRAALDSKAITIAILGCGVDIVYPPEHKNLYTDIINHNGAVISEVTPGHTVLKGLFPSRNRIISGLSMGILITEGAEKSGSIITPRYAAEQGREVFAVPGPITSYLSAGPSKLIKQGAKLVSGVEDILEELNINAKCPVPNAKYLMKNNRMINGSFSEAEKQLISILEKNGEMFFDEMVKLIDLPTANMSSLLSMLELKGIVNSLGNGRYGLRI